MRFVNLYSSFRFSAQRTDGIGNLYVYAYMRRYSYRKKQRDFSNSNVRQHIESVVSYFSLEHSIYIAMTLVLLSDEEVCQLSAFDISGSCNRRNRTKSFYNACRRAGMT